MHQSQHMTRPELAAWLRQKRRELRLMFCAILRGDDECHMFLSEDVRFETGHTPSKFLDVTIVYPENERRSA